MSDPLTARQPKICEEGEIAYICAYIFQSKTDNPIFLKTQQCVQFLTINLSIKR